MIPAKYYGIAMPCLAAIIISVPIAFIMVAMNLGLGSDSVRAELSPT